MKKASIFTAALAFLFSSNSLIAQEKPEDVKSSEEIVIRKNGTQRIQLTVDFNGDQITINGKPLSEFKNDSITINTRKMVFRKGDRLLSFDFGDGPQELNFNEDAFQFSDGDSDNNEPVAFLGVTSQSDEKGAKITGVSKASGAEKAGLKSGDVITKIDEEAITGDQPLHRIIAGKKPKDEVTVHYLRDGKKKKAKVILEERKVERRISRVFQGPRGQVHSFSVPGIQLPNQEIYLEDSRRKMEEELKANQLELQLEALEAARDAFPGRQKIGLKIQDVEEGAGVKVIELEKDSPAAKSGLQKDDIIIEINGEATNNTDEAREQLQWEDNKSTYRVKAKRNGKEQTFEIKIPKKLKTANL